MQATCQHEQAAASTRDIEVSGIWKTFGSTEALRGISMKVNGGERLAIVGPNGSGKSTLLKILATLLRPSAGTARVGGFDVQEQAMDVRRLIGVVSHQSFLYGELTTFENLEFYGRMYGVAHPGDLAREQLQLVGLEMHAEVLGRDLSRGMQQRLALARALIHDPQVLLLDEPDTGLDQRWAAFLIDQIAEAAGRGRTVLVVTHNLEHCVELADRVIVLNYGKVVFTAKRDELDVGSLKEAYVRNTGAAC
jgi:heme exporter protein A